MSSCSLQERHSGSWLLPVWLLRSAKSLPRHCERLEGWHWLSFSASLIQRLGVVQEIRQRRKIGSGTTVTCLLHKTAMPCTCHSSDSYCISQHNRHAPNEQENWVCSSYDNKVRCLRTAIYMLYLHDLSSLFSFLFPFTHFFLSQQWKKGTSHTSKRKCTHDSSCYYITITLFLLRQIDYWCIWYLCWLAILHWKSTWGSNRCVPCSRLCCFGTYMASR